MLAFQQMMQGKDLRGAIRSGAVGLQSARDNLGTAGDAFQLRFEGRRLFPIWMTQSPVARGQLKYAFSRRAVFSPGFFDDAAQDLAITLRRDRQAMFEIPCGKTAFIGIVAKFDL